MRKTWLSLVRKAHSDFQIQYRNSSFPPKYATACHLSFASAVIHNDRRSVCRHADFELELPVFDEEYWQYLNRELSVTSSPTNTSNWILPGRLIIGANPSPKDAERLVQSGVTSFVSLLEYDTYDYQHHQYPSSLQKRIPEDISSPSREISTECDSYTIQFLHFPILHYWFSPWFWEARWV
jgi:hypothetical protein